MATVEAAPRLQSNEQGTVVFEPANAISIPSFIERVQRDLGSLPGISSALQRTQEWSAQENVTQTAQFFEQLRALAEKEQAIRDELGTGMEILRTRLKQLMDPESDMGSVRFGSGIRGELIAKGGMGAVHKVALHGRIRAAKQLSDDRNEDLMARFFAEQDALQLLNGNIGPQFDGVEVVDGKRHIVMEWINGKTLFDLVNFHGGQMAPEKAYGVLASLAAAERNLVENYGIFHRDLKPQNVMVNPETGEVKIIDFGIMARRRSETKGDNNQSRDQRTRVGSIMGTPCYASREQMADFSTLDPSNESFALGATAYFTLTGEPPCPTDPYKHAKWNGDIDFSHVPEEAKKWLAGLLAKNPKSRTSIAEAGRFAFDRSEHARTFASWEEFCEANNARRGIDPRKVFGDVLPALDLAAMRRSPSATWRIVNTRNVIGGVLVTLLIGGVSILAIIRGNDTDALKKNGDDAPPMLPSRGPNLEVDSHANIPPIAFPRDKDGKANIQFRKSGDRPGSLKEVAEISADKGIHFRRKSDEAILGSHHMVDDPLMAKLLGVDDPSKLPDKWSGGRVSWEVRNNGYTCFSIASIGIFLQKPDGSVKVFALPLGKGLPTVQSCGLGNILGYDDRYTDPDYQKTFQNFITSDLMAEDVEIGNINNFPPPKDLTKEQWLNRFIMWVGNEQTFISKALIAKNTK